MKWSCVCIIVALLIGCLPKATPVTPLPLSAQEQSQLAESMRGHWRTTHIKEGEGAKKTDDNFEFTFVADGTLQTTLHTGFGSQVLNWKYALDGRNVTSNGPFKVMRVDNVTPTSMELFNYEVSTTYYVARR